MLPHINPTETSAWKKLQEKFKEEKQITIKDLFDKDVNRFEKYSLHFENIFFDYSKNIFSAESLQFLISLAKECELPQAIEAMFTGEKINETENRAVLHTALRNFSGDSLLVDGEDITNRISEVQLQMKLFVNEVHSGTWKGYTGKKIKYIVNIGIGGSDLGPVMITEALKPYWHPDIHRVHPAMRTRACRRP